MRNTLKRKGLPFNLSPIFCVFKGIFSPSSSLWTICNMLKGWKASYLKILLQSCNVKIFTQAALVANAEKKFNFSPWLRFYFNIFTPMSPLLANTQYTKDAEKARLYLCPLSWDTIDLVFSSFRCNSHGKLYNYARKNCDYHCDLCGLCLIVLEKRQRPKASSLQQHLLNVIYGKSARSCFKESFH